jgi:hypothetical protein
MRAMSSTGQWKYLGEVSRIDENSLKFPSAPSVHGLYWFSVKKDSKTVAGYVGQAAGQEGLAQRFRGYVARGRNPVFTRSGSLGTTSRNARNLLDALIAHQTVSVFVIDDPALADKAELNAVEKDRIGQLRRSGVVVWNRAGTR